MIVPKITKISSNSGSIFGSELEITGTGFVNDKT